MIAGAVIMIAGLASPQCGSGGVLALARGLEQNGWRRMQALEQLRLIGPAAAPAIPALLCVVEREIQGLPAHQEGALAIREAEQTLSAIGPDIIQPILRVLDAPCGSPVGAKASNGRPCRLRLPSHQEVIRAEYCQSVRYQLAEALGGLDGETVPSLIHAFRQTGPRRQYLAYALGLFGERAAPAVPDLVAGLDVREGDLWFQCAFALGQIGPPAKQALPALRRLLATRDKDDLWKVREAMRKIEQRSE